METGEPVAYFITWTVYGTFLQGDPRGWRRRRKGEQPPQPDLRVWHCDRLNHPVRLLDESQRSAVETEIERLAQYRNWHVWAHSARTNHVHVVVTANDYAGRKVRDQFKANCTRVLRERWSIFTGRAVWTTGGDWQCINNEEELQQVIEYVNEAQDRMGRDERNQPPPSAAGR